MTLLSRVLGDLYRETRGVSPPQFREAALEAVKRWLPFDSGLWGTGLSLPEGARVHAVYLHDQPEQMMRDYERIKQHDWLHFHVSSNPDVTLNVSAEDVKDRTRPEVLEHIRRYAMDHVLATLRPEPALNLWTAISFYRGPSSSRFTEAERKLKEGLVPHLVEAWHLNAFHFLEQPPASSDVRRARALIDGEGHVYNAEAGFAELVQSEFPDWQGPRVPDSLLGVERGSCVVGERTVMKRGEQLRDGLTLVYVRTLTEADQLSPRELTVARAFARGSTYREIAGELGTSPATVRNQLQAAYDKLRVSNKAELILRLRAARDLDG